MGLGRNLDIAEYGSITIRLTPGATEADFLGFKVFLCDSEHTIGSETLVGEVYDANMAYYDFNLNYPETAIYYFNCYSIDTNYNQSVLGVDQKIFIEIGRTIEEQKEWDELNDQHKRIPRSYSDFIRGGGRNQGGTGDDFQLWLDWLKGGKPGGD